MSTEYADFIATKRISTLPSGFDVEPDNLCLFDFQRDLVRWSLRIGKSAIWADCGLGKSLMELSWADHVVRELNRPVLILAPLAVSHQTVREGEKFGIEASVVIRQSEITQPAIYVTNYEKLHHFNPSAFGGIVLDESSCLKSFTSVTRNLLIERFASTPMRLCCSATPAPNDFMELGSHSEFLGVLTRSEMLSTFFVHDGGDTSKWRLKGHAEEEYWKWMCSWAVMMRRPSDLGYEDGDFILPPLNRVEHVVKTPSSASDGLFSSEARTLIARRGARRDSLKERVELAASLVLNFQPCGNVNTKKTESAELPAILNTQQGWQITRSPDSKTQSLISDTCKAGTQETRSISRLTTQGLKTESVEGGGLKIGTLTIPHTKSNAKLKSKTTIGVTRKLKNGSTSDSSGLPLSGTEKCLLVKTGDALFAGELKTEDINTSPLITATQPDKSEGFFANDATSDSVSSKTILSESNEPPTISDKPQWVVWCGLNIEQDAMARALGDECVSIYGSLTEPEKERRLAQWLNKERRVLLSKVSIFGWGLNLQQCHNVAFLGLSDSFEEMYQGIRRFWRFGQTREVNCHIITSEAEGAVVKNIERKENDALRMAREMVKHMSVYNKAALRGVREVAGYCPSVEMTIPSWLKTEVA